MAGFYATHYDLFPFWVHWAMHHNVFLKVSAAMYIVFAVGLFMLGAEYHAAIVRQKPQEGPGQFPPGYFTMLVVQLLPLMITGFVLQWAGAAPILLFRFRF